MKTYNAIMEKFWLVVAIALLILVTYLGIREGFDRWYPYYLFPALGFFAYFMRKFMRKRMEKHVDFLEDKLKKNQ
jgi:hypothetical protein